MCALTVGAERLDSSRRCPACGYARVEDYGPYRNTGPHAHPGFAGLRCRTCAACGTGWCDAPSEEVLADYYGRTYVPAQMEGVRQDRWPLWDNRAGTLLMLGRLFGEIGRASCRERVLTDV